LRIHSHLQLVAALCAIAHCSASQVTSLPTFPSTKTAGHSLVTRSHTFTVHLPLAETFMLFEPVGEKAWADGFDPIFATPESANLGADSIFTHETSHGGAKQQTIWLITRYDRAAALIEYRAVYPGVRVAHITVQCHVSDRPDTDVEVTYHYTGLSDEGDHYIATMTEKKFGEYIEGWASAIRAYLARGTPATP
jgi:hypothetical protein